MRRDSCLMPDQVGSRALGSDQSQSNAPDDNELLSELTAASEDLVMDV